MLDMSASAIVERFNESWKEKMKKRDIICPYCNHVQDNETKYHYVTYWGEDGEKECDCESCNKKFMVYEEVERQFKCNKINEGEKE